MSKLLIVLQVISIFFIVACKQGKHKTKEAYTISQIKVEYKKLNKEEARCYFLLGDSVIYSKNIPHFGDKEYYNLRTQQINFRRNNLSQMKFDACRNNQECDFISWADYMYLIEADSIFNILGDTYVIDACINPFFSSKKIEKSSIDNMNLMKFVYKEVFKDKYTLITSKEVDSLETLYKKKIFYYIFDKSTNECDKIHCGVSRNMYHLREIRNNLNNEDVFFLFQKTYGYVGDLVHGSLERFLKMEINDKDKILQLDIEILNPWAFY